MKDTPFLDDWTPEDYETLARCLKNTCGAGGFVCAAFCEGALKGFASVEAGLFGGGGRYLELSSLHVSQELRGQGVGKKLLHAAVQWARGQGAKRLYISAHPAVESQAFYRAMGCTPAQVCRPAHAGRGPAGRPLELLL